MLVPTLINIKKYWKSSYKKRIFVFTTLKFTIFKISVLKNWKDHAVPPQRDPAGMALDLIL